MVTADVAQSRQISKRSSISDRKSRIRSFQVVSTLPGIFNILNNLRNLIDSRENFVQVRGEFPLGFASISPLDQTDGRGVGHDRSEDLVGPSTSNDQRTSMVRRFASGRPRFVRFSREFVGQRLAECNTPLYVKLVFDEIKLWKSYTKTQEKDLAKTVSTSINKLLGRIENQHGHVLVEHALSYITASRSGLSEAELEDLISLDETVLNDVYQYHLPPVRRIPPLLWTRIRNDLPNYLVEREAEGVSVVSWYHRQFAEGKFCAMKMIDFLLQFLTSDIWPMRTNDVVTIRRWPITFWESGPADPNRFSSPRIKSECSI